MFKVWSKLKAVKQGLKDLQHQELSILEEKIDSIREELGKVQTQLVVNHIDVTL